MTPVPLRDVLDRDYVGASEADDLRETVRLLRENDADVAVVLRGDDVVGLLTAGDVLDRVAAGDLDDCTVGDAVTGPPVTLDRGATLAEAANALRRKDVDHVLVTDGAAPVGVVGARDVTAAVRDSVDARPDPGGAPTDDRDAPGTEGFSAQSVCEVCGGLSGSLANVNGQLVCADCHGV